MKMLYFLNQNSSNIFFCDPYFYAIVQRLRLLDHVILLHASVLGMTLKALVSI